MDPMSDMKETSFPQEAAALASNSASIQIYINKYNKPHIWVKIVSISFWPEEFWEHDCWCVFRYLLCGDLSEAAKLVSTERCVYVCAWAYSFRLSLRPTGGTLMPLSEANMLPLHFFSCPISLSLAPPYFLCSSALSPTCLRSSKHICFSAQSQLEGRPSNYRQRRPGYSVSRGFTRHIAILGVWPGPAKHYIVHYLTWLVVDT